MTPEILEGIRWLFVLVLVYFFVPLKKKVEKNCDGIVKNGKDIVEMQTHYGHIKESLDEIKDELRELNGKKK